MIKNYLKIALRQLNKQKMYGAIKIGGFALSIAACLLIGLYIKDELSYDKTYPDADRIYRVIEVYTHDGKMERGTDYPAPMAAALKADFPEIEKSARLMPNSLFWGAGSNELRRADQVENTHEEGFTYADQQLLDMLKLPMVYGDRAKALAEPNTMVISKRKADKYFPNQNPVGKVMFLNGDQTKPYRIGGVMENFPTTSHLQYDFMLTLTDKAQWPGEQQTWDASNYPTYVMLKPGANVAQLEKKITADIDKNYILPNLLKSGYKDARTEVNKLSFQLQPIGDVHLKSYNMYDETNNRGDIRFIWLFGAIAGFILTIACINFINLSTAKSANRAKEVGLRKVVGSTRGGLINQFLAESMLYSVLSFAAGLVLAWAILPYFNILASKTLSMPWLSPSFILIILASALIVGVLAGIYPAFYLSSFKPASVLKGSISTGSKNSVLRNGLVVFQFTTSIILIISTFVIYNQMQYILNKDTGYNKDQVLMLQGTNTLGDNGVKTLKEELLKLSSIKSVSVSDYLPVAGTKRNGNTMFNYGKSKIESGIDTQFWTVDDSYFKTFGIKLLAGSNFSANVQNQGVIINQTMAKQLNLKDPVGKSITHGTDQIRIIGVIKDFNFESLRDPIKALCLSYGISNSIVSVKINGGNMRSTIAEISSLWKGISPAQPLRYTFMDERFASMYADVQQMGQIFTSFAILAIIIACLGLFALAAFMAEQRSKEIGIRKVLGASVQSITRLLSFDFVKLVALSIVIASPIAWWAMNKWLQDFSYRAPISWWIFAGAGIVAIVIALATVSFQSIKAAIANPIRALKSE
ncbi:ABC transporter permease [Mucilaginibacter sp. BJC16-A38]|uniref:ABC transporter permease n=1 Tax=Mucilaginibacter phenanthrenivorans TaxID=1234842 RepID=UPI002158777B|nr:ABC transporter permease [Mucilaginibacter phenanthrenivorans]MCR8561413.1 ABC transporter permease [Mucilaginibacter phenanthrenivorans]